MIIKLEPIETRGQWRNARGLRRPKANRRVPLELPHERERLALDWPAVIVAVVVSSVLWAVGAGLIWLWRG